MGRLHVKANGRALQALQLGGGSYVRELAEPLIDYGCAGLLHRMLSCEVGAIDVVQVSVRGVFGH